MGQTQAYDFGKAKAVDLRWLEMRLVAWLLADFVGLGAVLILEFGVLCFLERGEYWLHMSFAEAEFVLCSTVVLF